MTATLRIGTTVDTHKPFTLPESIVTSTVAILAKKGAGKTYAAGVIEEEMARQHLPFVVLDPIGVHYGLRSSADGASPGYPVVVFGGEHGDVPLDRRMGADLAKTIINENISAIVDFSDQPSKSAWREIVRDFCIAMFKLNRTPRHVFIEEATEFVPQRQLPGMQETYEAVERMCRLGRNHGLGVSIISQRSAQVAKDVLSQIDVLIALRHTGKHDRDAIIDALKDDLSDEQLRDDLPVFRNNVTRFKDGEAFVWWPKNGIFTRIMVRERTTYHAGATPTFGTKSQPVMASPDIDKLRQQFKAVVEQREADDPKKLRAKIAELERELKKPPPAPVAVDCGHEPMLAHLNSRVEIAEEQAKVWKHALKSAATALRALPDVTKRVEESLGMGESWQPTPVPERRRATAREEPVAGRTRREPQQRPPATSNRAASAYVETNGATPHDSIALSASQQRILDALASLEALGVDRPQKSVVAVLSGASPTSGGYFNNLGKLNNQLGLVEYRQAGTVSLTREGHGYAAAGAITTLEELHERWCNTVSGSQAAILRHLIDIYPDDIAKDALAEAVGVSPTSGGFFNNLGRLRSLGAIDYPSPGRASATELLFPMGLR